jgi:hypothetical protein
MSLSAKHHFQSPFNCRILFQVALSSPVKIKICPAVVLTGVHARTNVLAATFHPQSTEREVLSAGANKTLCVTRYARVDDDISTDVGHDAGDRATSMTIAALPAPALCVDYNGRLRKANMRTHEQKWCRSKTINYCATFLVSCIFAHALVVCSF